MFNFGAIGQGVAGTIQSGVGLMERRSGKKMAKRGEKLMKEAWDKRTDYQIPDAVNQNVAQSQLELGGKSALQQGMENAANSELSNNVSAVRRFSTSSADALAAASGANAQASARMNDAAAAGAQERGQNLQSLYQARNTLADYKTMQWDMNVNMPFLQRLQFAQGMIAAGQNQKNSGTQQFVQGQNQIGQSAANFFSVGGMGGK
jgi:hypothetical protein